MGDAADSRELRKTFLVPAIKPFDHYDFARAKIACNLAWLVAKAFGTENVPEELREPFYTDQYDQEHIKPPVVNLLLSAELYCRAGSLILKSDAAKPLVGHDAVIQALAQKGLYVTDQEKLVTERDLHKKPIQMSAHLAMIDTLMMAYTVEMISIEKVIACAQQYSSFFQATDLPYDIEDAVMYWINKVNQHLKDILEQEQKLKEHHGIETPMGQKSPTKWFWKLVPARYRKEQTLLKQLPCIPLVENLLKDGTDGCALAALIHFYCPDIVKLEDICLKETLSLADSLYNLQLIQEFCQEYLNQCCHFTLEDMLYAASSVKSNYLVFMAELFWWFEVVKPSFVQPRVVVHPQAESVKDASTSRFNANRRNYMGGSCDSDFIASVEGQTFTPSHQLMPSRHTHQQPYSSAPGVIRRSTSMSYMDGYVGTWPKEKRSSVHGVSFDISFDKENSIQISTPNRGITRSVSNEGLAQNNTRVPKHIRKNLSFKPVNGEEETQDIEEEKDIVSPTDPEVSASLNTNQRNANENNQYRLPNGALQNRAILDDFGNQIETPSIEEALQIIHDTEKSPGVIQPDQITNGFFLHNQEMSIFNSNIKLNQPSPDIIIDTKGALSPVTDNTEVDTGIHVPSEDIPETMDEDSSLRDYTVSMDSDMEEPSKFLQDYDVRASNQREQLSPCPSSISTKSQAGSSASSSSGVKMTSFAEQKFRKLNHTDSRSSGSSSQKTTPEGSELNIPHVVAWAHIPEETPLPQARDTTQLLASEMVHLRMKLEEKRRAIEAQKKKVEAAFTKQRQKMGRTAFLNVVKKKGDGVSPFREEAVGAEDEKSFTESSRLKEKEAQKPGERTSKTMEVIKENTENSQSKNPATPVDSEKQWNLASPSEETLNEGDILEYTKSIEKLNSSLHFLQQEMQRLSLQQEMLMQMREQQAWVISPPQPSPQKQIRELKSSSRQTGSSSPTASFSVESPRPTHQSPQSSNRKNASFPIKMQRTPRPNELKITPLNRTLTAPRSVDSLPRLRRFSPSQVPIQTRSFVCFGDDGERVAEPQLKGNLLKEVKSKEEIAKEEQQKQKGTLEAREQKSEEKELKPVESKVSEVLSQPITETVCLTPNEDQLSQPVLPTLTPKTANLIEVSLSDLKPPEKAEVSEKYEGESDREQFEDDQKVCCGFFFKDDQKAENDMAVKRAALLEKRLRRERETLLRKQQLEAELEHKKEETRRKTEEERQKKEDDRARREFIKQEYMRRKQLKLMEEMDTVIKPRPHSSKQKKPRPKSIHRDHIESPKTPVKGPPVSSLSLASLNTGDNESVQSGKRTPRSESVEGFLSPSRCGSRNGEKDWENASTTSSVASATEYTGPKLYKEPSAKSNKHIIQNALAHCCLAGKVNEGQKKKILEEMEKSDANNFLILFRDSGCQFRSLYTYCPDTEEINKLTGIGPKSITKKMIEGLYKYNSDRKQFSHIPAKTLSASVDAITIHSHLWQTKRPVTPKKLLSTKA
ncbi:calmodulin-regulated spectrin-associated protein 2 isoform X2 [Alligator mississippiensis]|uniref:calmodulin-regulated spectrin-associated protein 2 isoform X2 n=1 Tax=Alligator mississippiensis TaxID=8496 RepID=UPI00090744FB|nr:calmodulin-regulated spectrin-associated protein 2 isoform X2 [Alligator mississippiensis]